MQCLEISRPSEQEINYKCRKCDVFGQNYNLEKMGEFVCMGWCTSPRLKPCTRPWVQILTGQFLKWFISEKICFLEFYSITSNLYFAEILPDLLHISISSKAKQPN